MKQLDFERIGHVVAERLRRRFENITIIEVKVSPDIDRDGEDILRIEVVFEGELKGHDVKQVAGAARHLRPALKEIDADLFPLLSFVSRVDYGRGRLRGEAY